MADPPADSPRTVMLALSPPKAAMFARPPRGVAEAGSLTSSGWRQVCPKAVAVKRAVDGGSSAGSRQRRAPTGCLA